MIAAAAAAAAVQIDANSSSLQNMLPPHGAIHLSGLFHPDHDKKIELESQQVMRLVAGRKAEWGPCTIATRPLFPRWHPVGLSGIRALKPH